MNQSIILANNRAVPVDKGLNGSERCSGQVEPQKRPASAASGLSDAGLAIGHCQDAPASGAIHTESDVIQVGGH